MALARSEEIREILRVQEITMWKWLNDLIWIDDRHALRGWQLILVTLIMSALVFGPAIRILFFQ